MSPSAKTENYGYVVAAQMKLTSWTASEGWVTNRLRTIRLLAARRQQTQQYHLLFLKEADSIFPRTAVRLGRKIGNKGRRACWCWQSLDQLAGYGGGPDIRPGRTD